MPLKPINKIVSYYPKPALGTIKEGDTRYMALSVDKESINPYFGLAREITKSKGSVDIPGFVDESKLIIVQSKDLLSWEKISDLKIKGIEKIIKELSGNDKYFIGLEDPDIYIENKLKQVFFTIAFKYKNKTGYEVYLGHAQGKSLNNLTATQPNLSPILNKNIRGFKEVAISPIKINGKMINLTEAQIVEKEEISAIEFSKAKSMSKPWKHLGIALDPTEMRYRWCRGHLSPCYFFPKDFVNYNNLLICIVNGREPDKSTNNQKVYGKFRPGLILFNPETGEIPWVSKEPLFEDPDARTITFASDFIQTKKDEGLLYAHVNDSFVRVYKINAKELQKYLDENCNI